MSLRVAAICAMATLLAMPATAQTNLKIPRDTREMQKIMRESDSHCSTCGVVTNVARVETGGSQDPLGIGNSRSGDPGPGTEIGTTPVFRPGSNPLSEKNSGSGRWRIIVRYDDGSYASFDQLDKPTVAKGDRIQVIADRVELR